jgi:hypothetical protein
MIGESVFSCSAMRRLPSIGLRGYLSFHVKSNAHRASGGESAAPVPLQWSRKAALVA